MLKTGKSAGLDNVQAEHFKFADTRLICLLTMLFNSIVSHGYMPPNLMKSVIVPIIKDKRGQVTDKNNYRPIAMTSVSSKILELLILERYSDALSTTHNQFGFKEAHGTDLCIFTLKQVIEFYRLQGSPVYICYLDASKAFDRINHWTLFTKILKRDIPTIIVRLLVFWYTHQQFCVRWGQTISSLFITSNGVRQGGIMSPILFNVYMNDLSIKLTKLGVGCKINGVFINHLLYADDSCLLAPSPSALQRLLSLCEEFAYQNTVIFNESKTKCMVVKPRNLKKLYIPTIILNNKPLVFTEEQKYLGVFLSSNLSDDRDIVRHVRGVYGRGNMLISKFKFCSDDVKEHLFLSYCANVYGGPLWYQYKTSVYKKAVVAYNDIYRSLFKIQRGVSMSALYVQKDINSFNVIVRKLSYGLMNRLSLSDNILIKCITSSLFYMCYSSLTLKWNDNLFV